MIFLWSILMMLTTGLAHADGPRPLAGVALEFGGDTLVNAVYSDGTKSDIQAGRGLLLQGGAVFPISDDIEIQGTLGFKWTSTKPARNGEATWVRWPLEVLGFYRISPVRLGAGLVYQFGNRLKGSKDAAGIDLDFENALGFVLAGDYLFGSEEEMGAGLRYTNISYEPKGGSSSVEGSSFGVSFHYAFP